jgi:hypothetical protein
MNRLRKKIRKTIPFSLKKKRKPHINLNKQVKDLNNENYKTL